MIIMVLIQNLMNIFSNKFYREAVFFIVSLLFFVLSIPSSFKMKFICFIFLTPFFYVINEIDIKNTIKFSFFFFFLSGFIMFYGFSVYSHTIAWITILVFTIENTYFIYLFRKISPYAGIFFKIIFEIYRNFNSFLLPMNYGVMLSDYPQFMFLGRFGGIYLLSFLIIFINYMLFKAIRQKSIKKVLFILAVIILPSFFELNNSPDGEITYKAGFIQGTVTEEKFKNLNPPDSTHYSWSVMNYFRLTQKAKENNIDILVLPEIVFKEEIFNTNTLYREKFEDFTKDGMKIIIGSHSYQKGNLYNSLFLLEDNKIYEYQKKKLVKLIEDKYSNGHKNEFSEFKEFSIIPMICFESIYERNIIDKITDDPGILIVCSSDIKYTNSMINHLHASYAIINSAVFNRYVIRASHRGVSFISDNYGRIIKSAPMDRIGLYTGNVKAQKDLTFYAMNSGIVKFLYFFLFMLSIIAVQEKLL